MSSMPLTPPQEPEYAWELATLCPPQGCWSEEEYLRLTDGTNRRIEVGVAAAWSSYRWQPNYIKR